MCHIGSGSTCVDDDSQKWAQGTEVGTQNSGMDHYQPLTLEIFGTMRVYNGAGR